MHGYMDTRIQGHRDTKKQRYRIQGYKDTGIYRDPFFS